MKKIILLSLWLSPCTVLGQGSLPDPYSAPPSNSGFYYENSGQIQDHLGSIRNDVKYYTERTYPSMCLMKDTVSFWDYSFGDTTLVGAKDTLRRIDMRLVCPNANNQQQPQSCGTIKEYEESADHINYFLPHCGPSGITGVKGYARIVYENIFPNINFHMYSNAQGPKMYFEIKPGGNPNNINLLFSGQDSITDISGGLQMYLGSWQLVIPQAYAYQIHPVTGATTLTTWLPTWIHSGGGSVTVSTGSYDPSRTLVIGIGSIPTSATAEENLDWSVYYGDVGRQQGARLDKDYQSVYHGITQHSIGFPAENGQEQIDIGYGKGDWYISKFTNTVRNWATYYGGSHGDYLTTLKVYEGNYYTTVGGLWCGGKTRSSDALSGPVVPVGSFRQTLDAGASILSYPEDGLLASFNRENGNLMFNTYFGSSAEDFISDIAISNEHPYIYIVGGTQKAATFANSNLAQTTGKFPLYSGPGSSGFYFKGNKSSPGDYESFIARFNLINMSLNWSTLFGGDGSDEITHAKLYNGKLYVGGTTTSQKVDQFVSPASSHSVDRFPLAQKSGAFFQNSYSTDAGMQNNMFVSQFNTALKIEWSTMLGYSFAGIRGIEFNKYGNMYVLGTGNRPNYFASSSPLPNSLGLVPTYNSGSSYYETGVTDNDRMSLIRFDTARSIIWATKLHSWGGFTHYSPENYGDALAIDNDDIVYVATQMNAAAAPTYYLSGGYWQDENSAFAVTGAVDFKFDNYLLGFDNTNQLKWATFFGGSATELGSSDRAEDLTIQNGFLYLTGTTTCPNSPYTHCPYIDSYCDMTYNVENDGFISRFETKIEPTGLSNKLDRLLNIQIYPNPSQDIFNITFLNNGDFKNGEKIQVELIDQLGRVINSTLWEVKPGSNQFRVDATGLSSGSYYLNIGGNEIRGTCKITKL